MDYKKAGVDVEAGYKAVELMKEHVKKTTRKEVIGGLGGFGGFFSLQAFKQYDHPVLVSGTDGVGTKLKMAFLLDKHDTVGIDCVAMCVNDIVCSGAEPLFFLDYIACGKNVPEKIAAVVKGVAEGCSQANASLIGGETAEMPGFYPVDEYDLAGFSVGIADKEKIIDGSSIQNGDVLIGLAASGVHSNGFSLVRHVLEPDSNNVKTHIAEFGQSLGEELLTPTKIYVSAISTLIKQVAVKGISHITGGGFYENIPRMLPEGLAPSIQEGSWAVPPVFSYIEKQGGIDRNEMYHTFNMGIGMVVAVAEEDVQKALEVLAGAGEKASVIGKVEAGAEVRIW